MFEHRKALFEELLNSNNRLRSLRNQHRVLDSKIDEDAKGTTRLDDMQLHHLKKERLFVKDKMARILDAATES